MLGLQGVHVQCQQLQGSRTACAWLGRASCDEMHAPVAEQVRMCHAMACGPLLGPAGSASVGLRARCHCKQAGRKS